MSAAPVYTYREKTLRRTSARRRAQEDALAAALARCVCYVLLAGFAMMFSSLSGNSLMEKARRDYVRAGERTKAAKMDVSLLRERVERLTTMGAIDRWAASHGFLPPESLQANEAVATSGTRQD